MASETLVLGWVWQQQLEDSGWTGAASVTGSGTGPHTYMFDSLLRLGTVPGTGSSQTQLLLVLWSSHVVEKTRTIQCGKY